jgi:hypothetical protein
MYFFNRRLRLHGVGLLLCLLRHNVFSERRRAGLSLRRRPTISQTSSSPWSVGSEEGMSCNNTSHIISNRLLISNT